MRGLLRGSLSCPPFGVDLIASMVIGTGIDLDDGGLGVARGRRRGRGQPAALFISFYPGVFCRTATCTRLDNANFPSFNKALNGVPVPRCIPVVLML